MAGSVVSPVSKVKRRRINFDSRRGGFRGGPSGCHWRSRYPFPMRLVPRTGRRPAGFVPRSGGSRWSGGWPDTGDIRCHRRARPLRRRDGQTRCAHLFAPGESIGRHSRHRIMVGKLAGGENPAGVPPALDISLVYILDKTIACPERRTIRLVRRQRHPAHGGPAPHVPAVAAGERDKGGSKNRTAAAFKPTRAPSPAPVAVRPAPVMERRESPRLVVDPCPPPRIIKGPKANTVRHPIRANVGRIPHGAVQRIGVPSSVIIQILITGHFRRDVLLRVRHPFAALTRQRPVVERRGIGLDKLKRGRVPAYDRRFAGHDVDFGTLAPDFSAAFKDRDLALRRRLVAA